MKRRKKSVAGCLVLLLLTAIWKLALPSAEETVLPIPTQPLTQVEEDALLPTREQENVPNTVPLYEDGMPQVVELDGGVPSFSAEELSAEPYESYAPLDELGRCGTAAAMLDLSLMPTEERGSIGQVKPSGWHTVRYDDLIPDKYLYNRCHLIAFCLAGENANERNLITGTRAMNLAMLPYETMVAQYIETTGDRVAYRVTPRFIGAELVARGVEIEAQSVLDPAGISLHVFCYNVQDGVTIDYLTGESWRNEAR